MIKYLAVFDGAGWFSLPFVPKPVEGFLLKLIYCAAIAVIGVISSSLARKLIKRLIMPVSFKDDSIISEKRAKTLQSVLESVAVFSIYFVVIYIIMVQVSVGLSAVISAVGAAAAVAFGLGAQNLIGDFIAGFFIIFENQFSVGDKVEIQSKIGVVENIGLRSMRIRGFMGELYIIPNGSIGLITNYEKEKLFALVNVLVPYNEDIDRVLDILKDEMNRIMPGQMEGLSDTPAVLGISDFTQANVQITLCATVSAEAIATNRLRLGIERQLRLIIKKRFEKEGIRPPALNYVPEQGR